jgi:hypothetical protein
MEWMVEMNSWRFCWNGIVGDFIEVGKMNGKRSTLNLIIIERNSYA